MANAIYPRYKEALLSGAANISLTTENVRLILVDAQDYTYNSAHDFLDDIPAAARVATSGNLTGKTVTNGTFDADDVTLTGVTGDESEALVFYIHTGTESTSRLVAYLDTGWTGLPVTPNGGDIIIQFSASGIFAL